ncbi:hypothetical protein FHX81_0962 [Saccharothrix saharensis]|uniref:Uncharacterized protein n=1 Tax=Saccharothrix saharensis TaxID=571190 RepID=A0A543J782_9PSEU|nr:hypothetical protein [Saccharothrix saharensis]TQM78686.1 hypothetical protein FHX81_0962 [Saccharothrix saharensis]
MPSRSPDPVTLEADARARWGSLEPAVWTGQDSDGRRLDIAPGELLAPILRRVRLIAASDSLCEAVVAHLAAAGVDAEVDRVRANPRVHDDLTADGRGPVQVMALRAGDKVVPLRPGGTTVTIWPPVEGTELTGEPLAEITVTADADRWVPAARIADALKPHLS